jgi:hypothetical protein
MYHQANRQTDATPLGLVHLLRWSAVIGPAARWPWQRSFIEALTRIRALAVTG